MKRLNLLLWGNLVLVLGAANWIVQDKEGLLENGRVVLLAVEKFDPLSFMQGHYMHLQYPICEKIRGHLGQDPQRDGIVVLALDKDSIGTFRRFRREGQELGEDEQLLRYKVRGYGGRVKVAAESFFFQEGLEKEFDRAKFAELRVDAEGHTLLVALRDKDRKVIGARKE